MTGMTYGTIGTEVYAMMFGGLTECGWINQDMGHVEATRLVHARGESYVIVIRFSGPFVSTATCWRFQGKNEGLRGFNLEHVFAEGGGVTQIWVDCNGLFAGSNTKLGKWSIPITNDVSCFVLSLAAYAWQLWSSLAASYINAMHTAFQCRNNLPFVFILFSVFSSRHTQLLSDLDIVYQESCTFVLPVVLVSVFTGDATTMLHSFMELINHRCSSFNSSPFSPSDL